ncbi:MAG: hypothetical protein ACE5I5_20160 [Candidatus Heimdallarchaeota archaeon]
MLSQTRKAKPPELDERHICGIFGAYKEAGSSAMKSIDPLIPVSLPIYREYTNEHRNEIHISYKSGDVPRKLPLLFLFLGFLKSFCEAHLDTWYDIASKIFIFLRF